MCYPFHQKGVTYVMIEIVYEKEKQKPEGNEAFFRIPNNIRQIGEVGSSQKIYIEDYAYTYLCRISSENSHRGIAAILLGQANWKEGISYLFVKSAVALPDMEVSQEHLEFTQEIWNHVYEKNKEYFPDQEVVGWYLSIPGCSMELHEIICKTHLNHFGGSDKILFVMEPLEKEEAFYRYEEGQMSRQTGFYVYYEKNEPMHSFLIAQNQRQEKKSEEVDDSAVHSFRKKVEKNKKEEKQKGGFPLFKTAGVCAAVAVLAVGVLYLNDYNKLKNTQEAIAEIDKNRQSGDENEIYPVNGKVSENPEQSGNESEQESSGQQDTEGQKNPAGNEEEISGTSEGKSEDNEETSAGNVDGQVSSENTDSGNTDAAAPNKNSQDSSGQNTGSEDGEDQGQTDNPEDGLEGGNTNTENQTGSGEDSEESQAEGHVSYTIQQGDTITKISIKNYGSTAKVREICELNHLSVNDLIYPGQKILLP